MARGLKVVMPILTSVNLQQVSDSFKVMQDAVSKQSLSFKINIPSATGKSLAEQMGGGKGSAEVFKAIQGSLEDVGKLTQKYVSLKDTRGKIHQIFIQETKEQRDANGNLIRDVVNLEKGENQLAIARARGWREVGSGEAQVNFRKESELTSAQINKEIAAVNKNSLAAEKYLTQSKNMRGPQVEAARKAAQAVIDEGAALKATSPLAADYAAKVDSARLANEKFGTSLGAVQTGANVFQNFGNRITNALQQTIAYSFSIGLVYKAQRMLNESVQYAIQLNKEMTNIQVLQVEGAKTAEDIEALAASYNKLGQEMGASTLEIAKGSVEWLRQGRTIAETEELLKSSLMLGKLGAMEAADATNYLTSITNAFKIEAKDAASVVDKLINIMSKHMVTCGLYS